MQREISVCTQLCFLLEQGSNLRVQVGHLCSQSFVVVVTGAVLLGQRNCIVKLVLASE